MKHPVVPSVLYHYTCHKHGEPGIRSANKLRPFRHPVLNVPLVWMTDLELPDMWALGLTRMTLCCDRTAIRCSVSTYDDDGSTTVFPWWFWAREVPAFLRDIVEDPGAPMHWWVSTKAVPVTAMVDVNVLTGQTKERAQHA